MRCNFATKRPTSKRFGLLSRLKKALIMLFSLLEYYAQLRYSDTQKTEKNPIESIHFMPKMASQSTPEATWPTNYVTTVQPQHSIGLNEKVYQLQLYYLYSQLQFVAGHLISEYQLQLYTLVNYLANYIFSSQLASNQPNLCFQCIIICM